MPSTLNSNRSDIKHFCKCGLKSLYACKLLNKIGAKPIFCEKIKADKINPKIQILPK